MKYAGVIVDTRNVNFKSIIERHFEFLPGKFDCVVFHDQNSVNFDCIKHQIPRSINNLRDYNDLMTSEWFWDKLIYDKVLIFQNDSGLLRKGIEEFYKWDYVGAPWKFQDIGGNGGLSWRSVKVMKKISKQKPYSLIYGFEDVYFCNEMKEKGLNIAPREVCKKFSCETIFELGTLGYHAIRNYMSEEQCNDILNQYKNKA